MTDQQQIQLPVNIIKEDQIEGGFEGGSSSQTSRGEGGAPEFINITRTMQSVPVSLLEDFKNVIASLRTLSQHGLERMSVVGCSVKDQIQELYAGFEFQEWFNLEGLFYLTLFVTIFVCVLTISINIYRKIRYAIPATVNCWFCNCNTKVLYSLRNTWTCPHCHQYNGFTADGNYNRMIPAQSMKALNRQVFGGPPQGYKITKRSHELCSQCNINQVLKVFQLASFNPANEKNFNAEIEAEEQRLEKLYDICPQCKLLVEEILKREPEDQQLPIKRKSKVNKVPHLSTNSFNTDNTVNNTATTSTNNSARSTLDDSEGFLRDELFNNSNISSENDSSGQSFLPLDNLNIGSRNRNKITSPDCRVSPHYYLPSPSPPVSVFSMPVYRTSPSEFETSIRLQKGVSSVWKNSPLVQQGITQPYSVIDNQMTGSQSPCYYTYNPLSSSSALSHSPYNFRPSPTGSVFGGNKPLISPPKINSPTAFANFTRYANYYDGVGNAVPSRRINAATSMRRVHVGTSPLSIGQPCFPNQISRTSSQSSGFISQQGGLGSGGTSTPPPQQVQPQSQIFSSSCFNN